MDIRDLPLTTIDGDAASLADYDDRVVIVVNVASRCGLTPQYEKLEALQRQYGDRGFTVIGLGVVMRFVLLKVVRSTGTAPIRVGELGDSFKVRTAAMGRRGWGLKNL